MIGFLGMPFPTASTHSLSGNKLKLFEAHPEGDGRPPQKILGEAFWNFFGENEVGFTDLNALKIRDLSSLLNLVFSVGGLFFPCKMLTSIPRNKVFERLLGH